MSRGAGAALVVASAVYAVLIVTVARHVGAYYEEVVPYVLTPLDIRSPETDDPTARAAPRFVTSPWLPRLAFEPSADVRLPLLNQLYMTDHLSYGGVALAAMGIDSLWAARRDNRQDDVALRATVFNSRCQLKMAKGAWSG
jgi:hypothetical protein